MEDLLKAAKELGVTKMTVETYDFKYVVTTDPNTIGYKITTKAIIRALGRTSVVAIGEGERYKTVEEARAGEMAYTREYFRARRSKLTEEQKRKQREYQARYRERKRQERLDMGI